MPPSIPTSRHLEYAQGYLALGLLGEASDEIEQIEGQARLSTPVLAFRCSLYTAAKQWNMVEAMAKAVCAREPTNEKIWLSWAEAAKELSGFTAARDILLRAVPHVGDTSARLNFDLGRCLCRLGEVAQAREWVGRARRLDKSFKALVLDEPDLRAMWD